MKNIMRWIRLVLLLFVPIFCVVAVNFIGDTANLFHSSGNKEIALSILAGNATHGVGAMDERGVKRALIELFSVLILIFSIKEDAATDISLLCRMQSLCFQFFTSKRRLL